MESNKSIKCRVETCKHHDKAQYCTLSDIVVGSDKAEARDCCETECLSFKCNC